MTTETEITWFLIYYFEDGKSRRFFCKGMGTWRNMDTCGAYTFRLISKDAANDLHTVKCTQGHEITIPAAYHTERKQTDGLF
jgi:hypothetical protein